MFAGINFRVSHVANGEIISIPQGRQTGQKLCRSGLDVLQFIEQFQQLRKRLLTKLFLNLQVIAFHPRTHIDKTLLSPLSQGDEYPTLIFG